LKTISPQQNASGKMEDKMKLKLILAIGLIALLSNSAMAKTCKPQLQVTATGLNGAIANFNAMTLWRNTVDSMYGSPFDHWLAANNRSYATTRIHFGKWQSIASGAPCSFP
jgi:hypothetical protein